MAFLRDFYLSLVFRTCGAVRRFMASDGICIWRKGPYTLAYPPSPVREELGRAISRNGIDALFSEDRFSVIKNGRTTTAGIAHLPSGTRFFLKRNNNKGLKFTLCKLFAADRAFRAAAAADAVAKLGIPTPAYFLAGEARNGMRLRCGYQATEAITTPVDFSKFYLESPEAPAKFELILEQMLNIAAMLHRGNLYHGDLKFVNFYCTDTQFNLGIWDLDSVRIYENGIPRERRVRDVARIVSSLLIFAERNPAFPEHFYNLPELAGHAADLYSKYAGSMPPLADREIADLALGRWLSNHKLHHHYGGCKP